MDNGCDGKVLCLCCDSGDRHRQQGDGDGRWIEFRSAGYYNTRIILGSMKQSLHLPYSAALDTKKQV